MRLIDAEAYLDYIDNLLIKTHTSNIGVIALYRLVDMQETVDAVPVVRCKDCKWWKKIDGGGDLKFCTYVIGADFVRKEDDYCSRGERKDDEHTD